MIRIQRPSTVPEVLQSRGAAATATDRANHAAAPEDYRRGKKFDFNSTIYAAAEVKTALRSAQHDKCCFCEAKVTHISYGDIEHFRPKAAFRQRQDGPLERPGYYWLAYEWTNLFFCCQMCNQRHKQNLFPLSRARQRARSPLANLATEEPLFLNPEQDDLPHHLVWEDEYIYPRRKSRRGRTTIDALGLNRPELADHRRRHLRLIQHLIRMQATLQGLIQRMEGSGIEIPTELHDQLAHNGALLTDAASDSAEYAAMVRAALARLAP